MTAASRMRLHVCVVDSRRISPVPTQTENYRYTAEKARTHGREIADTAENSTFMAKNLNYGRVVEKL